MTAGKDRDQAFDDAGIFDEVMQKGFVAAFEEAFEINQRAFWVRCRGERGLEVWLNDVERFPEDIGDVVQGVIHNSLAMIP